jgi:neurotransmitter:Na+ symporter, NSS family
LETWSSRLGFLLASIGAAVGIGNIWRFSAVAGQNGGGAYLVPYLISIAAFAVPLMVLEFAAGREFRGSVVSAFTAIHRRLATIGWLIHTIVFCILAYYLVITGWTLAYLLAMIVGRDMTFGGFTSTLEPLAYFLVATLATGLTVSFGVRRGIERLTRLVMPVGLAVLLLLLAYATTLSGFRDGIDFLFRPDFSVLGRPSIWSAAVGQAFFSLSVGFAVLLVYGAYLDREAPIVSLSWMVAVADLSIALLAGLVIFPIVFTYGFEPTLGAELAFTTLPEAFEVMQGGRIIGAGFFLLVFLAALTSSISMLEANVAAVVETTGRQRWLVTWFLVAALAVLGLAPALSYTSLDLRFGDIRVLDFMDDTLGTLGLPISALLMVLVFRWMTSRDILRSQVAGLEENLFLPLLLPLTRYAIPPVLALILLLTLITGEGPIGTHLVPEGPILGTIARDVAVLVMLPLLLASTLFVVRVVLSRRDQGPFRRLG